jgi:hypothetical protein
METLSMDAIWIPIGLFLLWMIIRYVKPTASESVENVKASREQKNNRQCIEINETQLPLRVEGYVFRNYLAVSKYILGALFLVSVCFTFVAAMVMLAGPDYVTVRAGVIGLQEFVLIYPAHSFLVGTISSLGLFELHKKAIEDSKNAPRLFFERHVELIFPLNGPECRSVDIEYLGKGIWLIRKSDPVTQGLVESSHQESE